VSHSPRAHSCVVHPELKNTRLSLGGKYGRKFPGLLPCEVDLERAVGLGRAASRMDATFPVVDEALGLPSGESVAREMGVEPLTAEECGLGPGWAAGTPLWYYVLKEAETRAGASR
jgi:hypothetical protein